MKLDDWLRREGVSRSDLARKLNVFPSMVTMVLKGRRVFGPEKASAVVKLTGGAVTFDELYRVIPPKQGKGPKKAKNKGKKKVA